MVPHGGSGRLDRLVQAGVRNSQFSTCLIRAPAAATASAFVLFIRLLSAGTTCVGDCDETYNYWEPLHYLLYGFGFQTWCVQQQTTTLSTSHNRYMVLLSNDTNTGSTCTVWSKV